MILCTHPAGFYACLPCNKSLLQKQKILIQRLEIKHAEELQKQLEAQAHDHRRHLELRERLQQVPTVFFLQVSSS